MGITDRRLFDGRETLKEFPCTGLVGTGSLNVDS